MGKGSGGGGNTTTVQRSDPWGGVQGYLTDLYQSAQRQYRSSQPSYYPGASYTPYAPQTNLALDLTEQRALAGSPLLNAAQNQLGQTLSGDWLTANPYLGSAMNSLAQSIRPQMDATFESSGRYGSGAHANAFASALADAGGKMAYQNYADERANMVRGLALAPGLAQADYGDLQQLANVGAAHQATADAKLADGIARWNFAQMTPADKLAQYAALLQGGISAGGVTTTQQKTSSNPINTIANIAANGLGLLSGGGSGGAADWGLLALNALTLL